MTRCIARHGDALLHCTALAMPYINIHSRKTPHLHTPASRVVLLDRLVSGRCIDNAEKQVTLPLDCGDCIYSMDYVCSVYIHT